MALASTWNENKSTKPAFFVRQPNIADSGFWEKIPAATEPPDQTLRDQLSQSRRSQALPLHRHLNKVA